MTNPTFEMGDANRDGAINGLDYDLLQATMGMTVVFPGGASEDEPPQPPPPLPPLPPISGDPPATPAPLPPLPPADPTPHMPIKPVPLPVVWPAVKPSVGVPNSSVAPLPLLVMSAVFAGNSQGSNPSSQSALVGVVALAPVGQNKASSIAAPQACAQCDVVWHKQAGRLGGCAALERPAKCRFATGGSRRGVWSA